MSIINDPPIGSIVSKIQDIVIDEGIITLGLQEDLKELQRTMKQVQCFINDAEQREQRKGNKLLMVDASSSRSSEMCVISQLFSCLPNIQSLHKIAIRIRNLNTELDKISKLEEASVVRRTRTSELLEPNLVGKETLLASMQLVELILRHKDETAHKIGIVGTALTTRAWLCVSQEYSKDALLKEVLRNIGVDYMLDETVGELSRKLGTAVENKTLFITWNDTVHRVQLMSYGTGWELLGKCMNINEEAEVQNLRDIGIKIVRMCGGLPLAIKVISSQCFLYCALYPEGHIMYRADLIRYWIVEGFVEEQEDELLEDTAEEYYNELIHWNLLQPDPFYVDCGRCRMHSLLRRLAQHLSQDECFCGDQQLLDFKSLSKLRRISIVPDKGSVRLPDIGKEQIRARTLIIHSTKPTIVENKIFKTLPHIRVLSLQHCQALHCLLLAITQLCQLRCLGLSGTPINQVPKGIGALNFLNDLQSIPVCGRAIDNFTLTQDGWDIEELSGLQQLRSLSMVKFEKAGPCSTDFLINKKHLKSLELRCTDEQYSEEEVSNTEETFEQLIPPHSLEYLEIGEFFGRRYPTWIGTTHLSSLTYLILSYCKSCVHLPPVGHLPNLKYLQIRGATTVIKIGPEFVSCGVGNPEPVGAVAFPRLEWFIILDVPNLEEWTLVSVEGEVSASSSEVREGSANVKQKGGASIPKMRLLPRLKCLQIIHCPKLKALPERLGQDATSLKTLEIRDLGCLKVVENLQSISTLVIAECEGLERVTNLPCVGQLKAENCLNLRFVDNLDNLKNLFLTDDMQEISSPWVAGLQEQYQKLHGEILDVYIWTDCSFKASQ
uniref:NB-ARC domain-containing protein n=1 Tax=Setaria italica TaxID=4555 RepID=K3ZMY4_SETIT